MKLLKTSDFLGRSQHLGVMESFQKDSGTTLAFADLGSLFRFWNFGQESYLCRDYQ